jgi:hypothetical protein
MILAGELATLAAEYRSTWSGRCRSRQRTAYTEGEEGLRLRSDFIRWLCRLAHKQGGNMILTERIERDGKVILVLEGDDKGKTVEHCLAEAIVRTIDAAGSVSAWAIHFASLHHPFSTTQRLREMKEKFRKWWLGELAERAGMESFIPGADDFAYRFDKTQFKYYFSPHFVAWLRREYLDRETEPADVPAR